MSQLGPAVVSAAVSGAWADARESPKMRTALVVTSEGVTASESRRACAPCWGACAPAAAARVLVSCRARAPACEWTGEGAEPGRDCEPPQAAREAATAAAS